MIRHIEVDLKVIDKRIGELLPFPGYATSGAAAWDIAALDSIELWPGETRRIKLGFAIHIKTSGIVGILAPRSGIGGKGLILSNTIGVIDGDFQGEIEAQLWNRITDYHDSLRDQHIIRVRRGERFAQLLFMPVVNAMVNVVDEFEYITDRGAGGFGSTGL